MKKTDILTIFLFTLFSINFVLAFGPTPSVCGTFGGEVRINGNLVNGTLVQAYYQNTGELIGNADEAPQGFGFYTITITEDIDSPILFKINGINVSEEQICNIDKITQLNLTLDITNFEGSFDGDTQSNIEGLTLLVGNSDDLLQGFFGTQTVNFTDGDKTIITFNYDFDSGKLNLSAIKINKTDEGKGSIQINGLTLPPGETKTVYIDKIVNTGYVCILDKENAAVSEMNDDCSNGIPILCNGELHEDKYTCNSLEDENKLEITGLTHSAVEESTYSPPAPTTTTTSSGGGGGGGGSYTCTENWECYSWSQCVDEIQTRNCIDLSNCGTTKNKPITSEACTINEDSSEESLITSSDETQETSPGITGAVIGAAKSTTGIVSIIVVLGLAGAFVVTKTIRKRKS